MADGPGQPVEHGLGIFVDMGVAAVAVDMPRAVAVMAVGDAVGMEIVVVMGVLLHGKDSLQV